MNTKIFLLIFLILILIINPVNALLEVEINVKPVFSIGDVLNFSYMILSDRNEFIEYSSTINCDNNPLPLVNTKRIILRQDEVFTENYYGWVVNEISNKGNCVAYVSIIKPYQQIFFKKFELKINPHFEFNILLDKKIFTQGEEIKIDYESSVEDVDVVAKLSLDDNQKKISLPYSFRAEQFGTYELEVIAIKEGYKTITKKEKFGIIKKKIEIPYAEKISFEKKSLFDRVFNLFRKPEYLSCSDTDKGLNSEEVGSVLANYIEAGRDKTRVFYDKCYNGRLKKFRGNLREFYCKENNAFAFKYIDCENGCEDGRCV